MTPTPGAIRLSAAGGCLGTPALIDPLGRRRSHLYALVGYAALAVIFTWPLAPQIGTHLTGSPDGDTGVYDMRRDQMLDALIWLSEGHELDPSCRRSLVEAGPSFAERSRIGFVIIDRARASQAIREFAIRAFHLQLVESDGNFELYRPAVAPAGA